jgi:hypothetical protein
MKQLFLKSPLAALIAGCLSLAACGESMADDLRDAAPPDSFMAIYAMQNPERDYQRPLYNAVFQEFQSTKLLEKITHVIQNRLSGGDAEQFVKVRDSLRTAVEPIEWEKLSRISEFLFVQKISGPTNLQLAMFRVPEGGAESLHTGITNLFQLAVEASGGQISVAKETVAGVEMSVLTFPGQMPFPFQPSIGVKDDLVVITTSLEFATDGLELLSNPSGESKFDDPRFVNALKKLPAPEDMVMVFDGQALSAQLQGIPEFIRQASGGNPEATRVSDIIGRVMQEFNAFDYEVAVEYTEGMQNRAATYGKLNDNADSTVLGKMIGDQKLFEDWTAMVPESTNGFSLSGGATLLPLYDWIMKELPEMVPEAQPGLDKFAAVQDQFDLHLREDLLEPFTGESVSINFPGPPTPFGGRGSMGVLMLRCNNPDRIQELIHRGMNALNEIPQVKAQGISLKEVPELEGFEEIKANAMAMTGARPVFGFRDGWMILGSTPDAVEKALATQSSDAAKWSDSERFKEFGLTIDGPVHSISYTNTGENIRNFAQGLQQAGIFAPMVLQMANAQNKGGQGPDLSVVQDILGLLPSVAKVIAKLDFNDATMTVSQPGAEAGSYTRQSVTLIKVPKEKKPADVDGASKGNSKKSDAEKN